MLSSTRTFDSKDQIKNTFTTQNTTQNIGRKQIMYDPYAEFTKNVLPNGLEVHSLFWDRPWIGVEVVVHSGAREDPVTMPGLAHFVEHAVSQNIPGRKFDQVNDFFENSGGKVEFGTTYYLSTRYKFIVPGDVETFREALSVFGSMLLGAEIKERIESERRIIHQEFNEEYPFLKKLEWDMDVNRSVLKGHRMETYNRPIGRPEGFLSAMKVDLQGFYDKHYVPANMSLVVLGGIQTTELLTALEKSPFGARKTGARNPIPVPFNQTPFSTEQTKTVKISDYVSYKVDQTEYEAAWAFPRTFPEQALRIFDSILEQNLSEEIREKSALTYGMHTNYFGYQDICVYHISGKINPDATLQINKMVRRCIEMVPSQLNRFKDKLRGCIRGCQMVDLPGEGLIEAVGDNLVMEHRVVTLQEVLEKLQKVTPEQMTEAAGFLSPDRQYTLLICP